MLYVMLVGAYPFERPEDKHDNQKLQKMIQVGSARECCLLPSLHAFVDLCDAASCGCLCWQRSEPCIHYVPQRILRVEYEFPPHVRVSRECKDLLKNILVPDPASRYTVEDIQRHPWYLKDLPPGVKEMNDNLPPPAPGLQASPHPARPCDCMSCSLASSMRLSRAMPNAAAPKSGGACCCWPKTCLT